MAYRSAADLQRRRAKGDDLGLTPRFEANGPIAMKRHVQI